MPERRGFQLVETGPKNSAVNNGSRRGGIARRRTTGGKTLRRKPRRAPAAPVRPEAGAGGGSWGSFSQRRYPSISIPTRMPSTAARAGSLLFQRPAASGRSSPNTTYSMAPAAKLSVRVSAVGPRVPRQ